MHRAIRTILTAAVLGAVLFLLPGSLHAPPEIFRPLVSPVDLARTTTFQTLRIHFVGDIMVHNTQIQGAYRDGVYDFSDSFAHLASYLREADFTIGNLETTLAGPERGYTGYPRFNAPDALAEALRDAGFDLLTQSNNHVLDTGVSGLIRTREVIERFGMISAGVRTDPEEDPVTYFEVQGLTVALVTGTYGTNGIPLPPGREYMVNDLCPERLTGDVRRAREHADLVLCFLHFGTEYAPEPDALQKGLADALLDAGALAVMGAHPHVVQRDEQRGDQWIMYSLGNFISAQRGAPRRTGVVYTLEIRADRTSGKVRVESASFLPVTTLRSSQGSRPYTLLPATRAADVEGIPPEYRTLAAEGLSYVRRTIQVADEVTAPANWDLALSPHDR